jgi:IS30 family transposase
MRKARVELSPSESAELWSRWKRGESLADISATLGRASGTVHGMLSARGGIAPLARHRSQRSLSLADREEISRGVCAGASVRAIAMRIGRSPSTVSRELVRNEGRVNYRAAAGDSHAWANARRPKLCKLAMHARLRCFVARKLRLQWSPEQISGALQMLFPDDKCMQVSHETIYRSLFIQARGVLKKELQKHLRTRRKMRRSQSADRTGRRIGGITDPISIRERPAEVEDRAIPGHWEGDLLSGSHNSHIATLVERQSRFTILVKVDGKDTESVVSAVTKKVRKLPAQLRRSLTWDRGNEMAQHKAFTIATDVQVYFCDPQSPWQRGTNENTNGLLRQYFPDGTELTQYSQAQLDKVALRLNQRPRKTLGFSTPADMLEAVLQ